MSRLTHFDATGQAHMVDVGGKDATQRVAVATGRIRMAPATFELIRSDPGSEAHQRTDSSLSSAGADQRIG